MSSEKNALSMALIRLAAAQIELATAAAHASDGLDYVPLLTSMRETIALVKELQAKVDGGSQ